MLFLDGVYVEGPDRSLTGLIASRVGRFVERQGLLERDAERACLAKLALDHEPMEAHLAHSITYRIAVGPRAGRKVFTPAAPAGGRRAIRYGDRPGRRLQSARRRGGAGR